MQWITAQCCSIRNDGATDKVYLVEKGKQAFTKDIVHIWDYADIDIFPDTEQQNIFFEQWAKR